MDQRCQFEIQNVETCRKKKKTEAEPYKITIGIEHTTCPGIMVINWQVGPHENKGNYLEN